MMYSSNLPSLDARPVLWFGASYIKGLTVYSRRRISETQIVCPITDEFYWVTHKELDPINYELWVAA